MLAHDLLAWDRAGDHVVPAFLGAHDHPWLRSVLEQFRALDGRPRRELKTLRFGKDCEESRKRRMVAAVLDRLAKQAPPTKPRPSALRQAYCLHAQAQRERGQTFVPAQARETVARELGCEPVAVARGLFADLAGERALRVPVDLPDPGELALRTNLALAQGLLKRALGVRLRLRGHARAVVRQAQLRRLLCCVRRCEDGLALQIDGAFALFRRTTMYGRALASLLPVLPWSEDFRLEATLMLEGQELALRLGKGDPIFPGTMPRAFDSKLEARFARDFNKAGQEFELLREPEPVELDNGQLMFPDFEIRRRTDPTVCWLLEIVGFWTADYLSKKRQQLARARRRCILCVDARLGCGPDAFPDAAEFFSFNKRIDVEVLLAYLRAGQRPPQRAGTGPTNLEGSDAASGGPRNSEGSTSTSRVDASPAKKARTPAEVGEQSAAATPAPTSAEKTARLGLGDLFVDYAGRLPAHDAIHQRLAASLPGDLLRLQEHAGQILLCREGGALAALSARARTLWRPRLPRVSQVRLLRLERRRRTQSGVAYRPLLRVAAWDCPLVEVRWRQP